MWSRHNPRQNRATSTGEGFTLIEVVIYLVLFAVLFGGAVLAAYNVIEGSGRNQTRAQLQAEGDFLAGKLSWVLSGTQTVSLPAVGAQGSLLTLAKYGGSTWTVSQNAASMELQNGAGTALPLNSSAVQLVPGTLRFIHAAASGNGTNPESILTTFSLTTKTPNGASLTQDFSTTTYLRR